MCVTCRPPVTMAAMNEQYRMCYTMKADGEDAEIMVYSEIVSEKWWDEEISTGDFDKALKEAKKNGARNLNIRINSPGGEVWAAVAMRSMVINAEFDNVRVMIEGLCASAATLFATIPNAHVVIASGSEFMIHNPMTFTWGNANQIEETVEHLRKMEQQFHGMYAARTGQTEEQIKQWMDATTWFTAKEAVENGFCDEMLETEKIAACVTKTDMMLMKAIYGDVPEQIIEQEDPAQDVSNGNPVAGFPSENILNEEENPMELENLTLDQLRDGNPALLAQVQQEAVAAERERLSDIDALTVPGYEEMAEQAKANGTSAIDFQREIVAAMKQRGASFLQARQQETEPAASVAGGAPTDNGKNEEQEIQEFAKSVAAYAEQQVPSTDSGMF